MKCEVFVTREALGSALPGAMPVCDGDLLHERFASGCSLRIIRTNMPKIHLD